MANCLIARKGNGGVDCDSATAVAANILTGYKAGIKGYDDPVSGTMPNNGSVQKSDFAINGSYTIPKGYHDGTGFVKQSVATISGGEKKPAYADATIETKGKYLTSDIYIPAEPNLVAANLADDANIFGVTGSIHRYSGNQTIYESGSWKSWLRWGAIQHCMYCNGTDDYWYGSKPGVESFQNESPYYAAVYFESNGIKVYCGAHNTSSSKDEYYGFPTFYGKRSINFAPYKKLRITYQVIGFQRDRGYKDIWLEPRYWIHSKDTKIPFWISEGTPIEPGKQGFLGVLGEGYQHVTITGTESSNRTAEFEIDKTKVTGHAALRIGFTTAYPTGYAYKQCITVSIKKIELLTS